MRKILLGVVGITGALAFAVAPIVASADTVGPGVRHNAVTGENKPDPSFVPQNGCFVIGPGHDEDPFNPSVPLRKHQHVICF